MNRNPLLIKNMAIGIFVVFICIAVVPSLQIHGVKASTDTSSIQITIHACGIRGMDTHTVSLTTQQYLRLEQYLHSLECQINETATPEEIVFRYNEAIVQLDAFGLLPKGMNIKQAQHLVTGRYSLQSPSLRYQHSFQRIVNSRLMKSQGSDTKNTFCFLFATLSKIPGYSPAPFIIPFGILLVAGLAPAILLSALGADDLAKQLIDLELFLWSLNPLRLFNFIICMGYDVALRSIGLKGLVVSNFQSGCVFTGYTGLLLDPFGDKAYFLGFALRVNSLNENI